MSEVPSFGDLSAIQKNFSAADINKGVEASIPVGPTARLETTKNRRGQGINSVSNTRSFKDNDAKDKDGKAVIYTISCTVTVSAGGHDAELAKMQAQITDFINSLHNAL